MTAVASILALSLAATAAPPPPQAARAFDGEPATAILEAMPATLLGLPAITASGSSSITYTFKRLGVDPIVDVVAVRSPTRTSIAEMRAAARDTLGETGTKRVVVERQFYASNTPGHLGVYGEYETAAAYKLSWRIEDGTHRVGVTATLFRPNPILIARARTEIADRVFGGISFDDASAIPDKDKP